MSKDSIPTTTKYTNLQLHEAYTTAHYKIEAQQDVINQLQRALASERYSNKVKNFIKKVFDTDEATIDRCLNKATTIVLQDDMICVMNDEWIYYFGSSRNKRFCRKEYNFSKLFNFSGKKLHAMNINAYKNHVKCINNQYFWV